MTDLFVRDEFPIFSHYPDLIYLDNAATTQKPAPVLEAERDFYLTANANVHRGAYGLAAKASRVYETTRTKIAAWLKAASAREVVLTNGATAGINLVALSWSRAYLHTGDAVAVSVGEHHANFIPWQQVCRKKNARLLVIPLTTEGKIDVAALEQAFIAEKGRLKMIALSHISNVHGAVNPVMDVTRLAQQHGAAVILDAAQSIATAGIDVQEWPVDFLVFSGHKMFGPTGTGALYVHQKWHNTLEPVWFGGGMVRSVGVEHTTFAPFPQRFEAGTPNLAGMAGLTAALDWIQATGPVRIKNHVQQLTENAVQTLATINGLQFAGAPEQSAGILSFTLNNIHPHDLATWLDQHRIAVRAGQHCAQPLMDFWGIPGTVRISFSAYNSRTEVIALKEALGNAAAFFNG